MTAAAAHVALWRDGGFAGGDLPMQVRDVWRAVEDVIWALRVTAKKVLAYRMRELVYGDNSELIAIFPTPAGFSNEQLAAVTAHVNAGLLREGTPSLLSTPHRGPPHPAVQLWVVWDALMQGHDGAPRRSRHSLCLFGLFGRAVSQPAPLCHAAILSVWQEV